MEWNEERMKRTRNQGNKDEIIHFFLVSFLFFSVPIFNVKRNGTHE